MTQYLQDTSDEKLNELVNNLYELYTNSDIINYTHNGKTLPFKYQTLISRSISSVYSNIDNRPSIQTILINAIKLSLNSTLQTKTTGELKVYRESCERFKMTLSLLNRKKQQGLLVDDSEIESKKKEIKMLEEKINEIATVATIKPEVNKKILTNAETIYNIMLRNDKVPKLLFIKFCKKIGYYFNYSDRFVDEYDKPNSINDMQTRHKPGSYVPPAFRTENKIQQNKQISKQIIDFSDSENEDIPENMTNKVNKNEIHFNEPKVNKNIGMWATKSKIIFKEEPNKDKDLKIEDLKVEDLKVNKNNEIKLSNEWELNDDF